MHKSAACEEPEDRPNRIVTLQIAEAGARHQDIRSAETVVGSRMMHRGAACEEPEAPPDKTVTLQTAEVAAHTDEAAHGQGRKGRPELGVVDSSRHGRPAFRVVDSG